MTSPDFEHQASGESGSSSDWTPPSSDGAASKETTRNQWALIVIGACAIALLIRFLLITPYRIPSGSMLPTIEIGDRVLVNQVSYAAGDIQRGQVVVFDRPPVLPGEDVMIKRVIGLPGESVWFVDGSVYIDDMRVVEPYLAEADSSRAQTSIPGCAPGSEGARLCIVPEGHVFVMGDNRLSSTDSRIYGPIPIDTIVGRAFVRVWPPSGVNQL